jgi:hypothetical protein
VDAIESSITIQPLALLTQNTRSDIRDIYFLDICLFDLDYQLDNPKINFTKKMIKLSSRSKRD